MAGYGNDDGFQTWLSGQGLALPVGAPTLAVLRQIGSDYVDAAYEHALQCSQRAGGFEQERAWPRVGHRVNGQPVPNDLVPPAWVSASYRAAYLQATTEGGWATVGVDSTRQTRREKVDSIEREFFAASDAAGSSVAPGMPSDSIINGMLTPWFCSNVRSAARLFRVI
ncbi:DnaT-like ssDNA-binding protein [Parapusillimonas sp. JC17]|uniref:DnaT-like ssDNA-binding protein n=1 Tax=Parapusillimonas sp. JC17 TaxID=3445768 RepID=UPI003FA1866F